MNESEDGTIMEAVANSDELRIFETDMIKEMIDYKWMNFAMTIHYIGAFTHLCYLLTLLFYINHTFLESQPVDPDHAIPMHVAKKND